MFRTLRKQGTVFHVRIRGVHRAAIPLLAGGAVIVSLASGLCASEAGRCSSLPLRVGDWKLSEKPQSYGPETLYKYIDGAAELYIAYDVENLCVAEYMNGQERSVIVELYRHRTSYHAFGIYSQERSPHSQFLNIGAQGYLEAPVLNFVRGNHYVKISCYGSHSDTSAVLMELAEALSSGVGGETSLPWVLDCFPRNGREQNSEKFVAGNFLGHEFLHSGFTAAYKSGGRAFELFIIEGESLRDAHTMLSAYQRWAQSVERDSTSEQITLLDRYHGDVTIEREGRYLLGVLGFLNRGERSQCLELMKASLRSKLEAAPSTLENTSEES